MFKGEAEFLEKQQSKAPPVPPDGPGDNNLLTTDDGELPQRPDTEANALDSTVGTAAELTETAPDEPLTPDSPSVAETPPGGIATIDLAENGSLELVNDLHEPVSAEKLAEMQAKLKEKKLDVAKVMIDWYLQDGPEQIPEEFLTAALKIVIKHNAENPDILLDFVFNETPNQQFKDKVVEIYDREAMAYHNEIHGSDDAEATETLEEVQENAEEADYDAKLVVDPKTQKKEIKLTYLGKTLAIGLGIATILFAIFKPESFSEVMYYFKKLRQMANPEAAKNERLERMKTLHDAVDVPQEFVDNLEEIPNEQLLPIFEAWHKHDRDEFRELFTEGTHRNKKIWDKKHIAHYIYDPNNPKSLVRKDRIFNDATFMKLDLPTEAEFASQKDTSQDPA